MDLRLAAADAWEGVSHFYEEEIDKLVVRSRYALRQSYLLRDAVRRDAEARVAQEDADRELSTKRRRRAA